MKIKIIAVGKLKKSYLLDGINDYLTRLNHYCKTEIIEVKDIDDTLPRAKEIEGESLLKNIKDKDYVIALTLGEEMINSEDLANKMQKYLSKVETLTFVIGGSLGLSKDVLKRANYKLTLSKFTFTHQMTRLIILEQLYRSFKIINNEKYHK